MMRIALALLLTALISVLAQRSEAVNVNGGGSVASNPVVPAVAAWKKITAARQGDFLEIRQAATCANYEGANEAACTNNTAGDASFTGSISGTTLTVTAVSYGTIAVGQVISATGIAQATSITALGSGSGGTGTYTVDNSQTVSGETMASNAPALQARNIENTINCTSLTAIVPYSGPAIDPATGNVFYIQPGGHAACQGTGVMEFKLQDARNNGGTANWRLAVKAPRFLPLSAGKPSWSNQSAGIGDLWATTNRDGQDMPIAVHEYDCSGVSPQGYVAYCGLFGGPTGNDSPHSGYFLDEFQRFVARTDQCRDEFQWVGRSRITIGL